MSENFLATLFVLVTTVLGLGSLVQDNCGGVVMCSGAQIYIGLFNILLYFAFLLTKREILFWVVGILSVFSITFTIFNL
ncbi:MAG: hypothetical protein V4486_00810 [Patescibacteria group bacterium]